LKKIGVGEVLLEPTKAIGRPQDKMLSQDEPLFSADDVTIIFE
jgi:hypothetical protein